MKTNEIGDEIEICDGCYGAIKLTDNAYEIYADYFDEKCYTRIGLLVGDKFFPGDSIRKVVSVPLMIFVLNLKRGLQNASR